MARLFSDDVSITVDDAEVGMLLARLVYATTYMGFKDWLDNEAMDWLQQRGQDRFAAEGDDASGDWEPLKPATRKIRHDSGYPPSHPINVRSGDLRDFLLGDDGAITPLGADGARLTWPGTAPSGLTKEKLRVAQRGDKFGNNNLFPQTFTPARPVLALSELDTEALLLSYAEWLYDFMSNGSLF